VDLGEGARICRGRSDRGVGAGKRARASAESIICMIMKENSYIDLAELIMYMLH